METVPFKISQEVMLWKTFTSKALNNHSAVYYVGTVISFNVKVLVH